MKDLQKMSQIEYDKLKGLCARAIGTIPARVQLGLITPLDGGKVRICVLHLNFYKYSLVYDGIRILGYARVI